MKARFRARQWSRLTRLYRIAITRARGWHGHWSEMGRDQLRWEEYVAEHPEHADAEVPF